MVSKLEANSKLSQRQQKELAREERRAPMKSMRKAIRGHAVVRECERQAIRWPNVVTLSCQSGCDLESQPNIE